MAKKTVISAPAPRTVPAPQRPVARPATTVAAPPAPKGRSMRDAATAVPAPTTPSAPANNGAQLAALLATIEAQKAEIAKLTAAVSVAKAKPRNMRTVDEIVNGAQLDRKDWRAPYHGQRFPIVRCDRDKAGAIETFPDAGTIEILAALPRDTDVGGGGTEARQLGWLAIHWRASEDGESFYDAPLYVSEEELGAIWPS